MTNRFTKGDWTNCRYDICEIEKDNEVFCTVATDDVDLIIKVLNENEELKEALREELQDNGNAYYIHIFDELFDLNYDEWDRNERYRDLVDWEKLLKEKGDDGNIAKLEDFKE